MGNGSWEQTPNVLVGILHVETTSMAWAFGLRHLQIPGGQIMPVTGRPFDHARNEICMAAIDHGFHSVFFMDSDIICPPDTILRLLKHNMPIVSGIYCRRSPPHAVPVMIKNGQWVTEFPKNKLFEVDMVGAGCLLINCEMLKTLPPISPQAGKQWFHWRSDLASLCPPGMAVSEDFAFNLHCKAHGIPTIIDPTIICKHIGSSQVGLGKFEPLDHNPNPFTG